MAAAQQLRYLKTQTTSGSVRLRVPCEVRDEVCRYASRRRAIAPCSPTADARAKVLLWDGTGLCVYQKRIERGRFTSLWRRSDEKTVETKLSKFTLFFEVSTLIGALRLSPLPTDSRGSYFLPPRDAAMLNLATETAIARLREGAPLLEQENVRLFRRLENLVAQLVAARGADARSLPLEIECLKEQLASRTKALFGNSSERRLCTEHERSEQRSETHRSHDPRAQKALPIFEVVH